MKVIKNGLVLLLVAMTCMPWLFAQSVTPGVPLKKYSNSVIDNARFVGRDGEDFIFTLRQAPLMNNGAFEVRPSVYRVGPDMKEKSVCAVGHKNSDVMYASLVNGKVNFIVKEFKLKGYELMAYSVDLATMTQVGEAKRLLVVNPSLTEQTFVDIEPSPSNEFVVISDLTIKNKSNDVRPHVAMYDSELVLQWEKDLPFYYYDIKADDMGEAVLASIGDTKLELHVVSPESDDVISGENNVNATSIKIVNITPTGKVVLGGATGTEKTSDGVFGAAADLENGVFLQVTSHKFTNAEIVALNNEKEKKMDKSDGVRYLSTGQTQKSDFGGVMLLQNMSITIYRNSNGMESEIYNTYGVNLMAIDTTGEIMWSHAFRHPYTEGGVGLLRNFVIIPRGNDVYMASSQSLKAPIETFPTDNLTAVIASQKVNNVLTVFHQDGKYSRKAFHEDDYAFLRKTFVQLDNRTYRVFAGKSNKVYYYDITF